MAGMPYHPALTEATLIFWHSGIPLEDATKYIKNLYEKLKNRSMI